MSLLRAYNTPALTFCSFSLYSQYICYEYVKKPSASSASGLKVAYCGGEGCRGCTPPPMEHLCPPILKMPLVLRVAPVPSPKRGCALHLSLKRILDLPLVIWVSLSHKVWRMLYIYEDGYTRNALIVRAVTSHVIHVTFLSKEHESLLYWPIISHPANSFFFANSSVLVTIISWSFPSDHTLVNRSFIHIIIFGKIIIIIKMGHQVVIFLQMKKGYS